MSSFLYFLLTSLRNGFREDVKHRLIDSERVMRCFLSKIKRYNINDINILNTINIFNLFQIIKFPLESVEYNCSVILWYFTPTNTPSCPVFFIVDLNEPFILQKNMFPSPEPAHT